MKFWKKRQPFHWRKDFDLFFFVLQNMKRSWNFLQMSTRYFDNFCLNGKITSLEPRRSIETNISKKNCFNDEKSFWPFFLVSSSVTNIKEQFKTVLKLFWQLLWKIKERFLGPKRLLRTQSCEKQDNISSEEKNFGLFFLVSSNMKNDKEHKITVHMLFWQALSKLKERFSRN